MTARSTKSIDSFGNTEWTNKHGMLHRKDGPACEYSNGDKVWYKNGYVYREHGPAVEYANNTKVWTSIGPEGIYKVNDHYVISSKIEYKKICKECGLIVDGFSYYSLLDKTWKHFKNNLIPTCEEEKMLRALA